MKGRGRGRGDRGYNRDKRDNDVQSNYDADVRSQSKKKINNFISYSF